MNNFELSRNWFNFSYENPDLIRPIHTAIYFFALDHANRMGNKEKFGFPTTMAMEAIGVKSYNTYIDAFTQIVDWGFIKLVEKSKNQYSANIIAISKNNKANNKALDNALITHSIKHTSKQSESTIQSTVESIIQSTDSIIKQVNKKTSKQVKKEFTPPSLEDVKLYFKEKGYKEGAAIKMFDSYSVADWYDTNGKKVNNWKQKAINVWFKDENRLNGSSEKQSKMVY